MPAAAPINATAYNTERINDPMCISPCQASDRTGYDTPLNIGGVAVMKKFAVVAICVAFLCGTAMAQDAKTVIANAQKALGDVKSITYSGTAKDVAFQQCGGNSTDTMCKGTHNPMRPINNYVRVIDLTAPASRAAGATNNIGAGGSTTLAQGTF